MICKNCKTAASDTEILCSYCGRPINSHRKLKMVLGAFAIILIVGLCGIYLYFSRTGKVDFPGGKFVSATIPKETEIPVAESSPEAPAPTGTPETKDPDEIPAFIWKTLEDALLAGKSYIINNVDISFTSKLGYLYNYDDKKYVTIVDLVSSGLIPEELASGNIWFLYINAKDLNQFEELNFSLPDKLELFTVCETAAGIALLCENYYGVLYRENFQVLMSNYDYDFPDIYFPTSGKLGYESIINAVKAYEFDETAYTVRYLSSDGKYAYIVFSKGADTNILYQYLLEFKDDAWQVLMPDIEQKDGYITGICKAAMDINYDLLPKFRIDKYTMPKTSFYDFIFTELIDKEIINPEEYEVHFISGTEESAYIELSDGMKFVSLLLNGKWTTTAVRGYDSARSLLEKFNPENPPLFILKQ